MTQFMALFVTIKCYYNMYVGLSVRSWSMLQVIRFYIVDTMSTCQQLQDFTLIFIAKISLIVVSEYMSVFKFSFFMKLLWSIIIISYKNINIAYIFLLDYHANALMLLNEMSFIAYFLVYLLLGMEFICFLCSYFLLAYVPMACYFKNFQCTYTFLCFKS